MWPTNVISSLNTVTTKATQAPPINWKVVNAPPSTPVENFFIIKMWIAYKKPPHNVNKSPILIDKSPLRETQPIPRIQINAAIKL